MKYLMLPTVLIIPTLLYGIEVRTQTDWSATESLVVLDTEEQ